MNKDFERFQRSLALVGFSSEEILQINEILASCILLGEIKFSERSGLDITYVDGNKGGLNFNLKLAVCVR